MAAVSGAPPSGKTLALKKSPGRFPGLIHTHRVDNEVGRKIGRMQLVSKSAQELITLSESENRIVNARYSKGVAAELFTDCDDYAETHDDVNDRAAITHEYWGETWRVHLIEYV